jgi:hypothetical protein
LDRYQGQGYLCFFAYWDSKVYVLWRGAQRRTRCPRAGNTVKTIGDRDTLNLDWQCTSGSRGQIIEKSNGDVVVNQGFRVSSSWISITIWVYEGINILRLCRNASNGDTRDDVFNASTTLATV